MLISSGGQAEPIQRLADVCLPSVLGPWLVVKECSLSAWDDTFLSAGNTLYPVRLSMQQLGPPGHPPGAVAGNQPHGHHVSLLDPTY